MFLTDHIHYRNVRQIRMLANTPARTFHAYPAWRDLSPGDDIVGTRYLDTGYVLTLAQTFDGNYLDLHSVTRRLIHRITREDLPEDLDLARIIFTTTQARLPEYLVELAL